MMNDTYRNPFSGVNAVQLDADSILEYWCSPFAYNLFSEIKEEDIYVDPQNIVLMGGRSTGKSMFLRYWSHSVQMKICERENKTLYELIKRNKGVGFYFRIDGAKLKSFQGHGFSEEYWTSVFTHYFELLVGRQYTELINTLVCEDTILKGNQKESFIQRLCEMLTLRRVDSFELIINEFDRRIKEVELYLGNVPFYKRPSSLWIEGFRLSRYLLKFLYCSLMFFLNLKH